MADSDSSVGPDSASDGEDDATLHSDSGLDADSNMTVSISSSNRPSEHDATELSSTGSENGTFYAIGTLVEQRYEIVERLGQGGFGAVYRAHDRELNRMVAIKRSTGLRSFVAGRVRDEAQAVASLSHPGIVAIYDLVTVSDDEVLIVMECLEGQTLSDFMQSRSLSPKQAIEIGMQIVEGLKHAHERRLVHSDLKPGNLFMTRDNSIKLLDFGLAVAHFADQENTIGGTPGFMSPEQIRGESHRIDGRADIWAFGVIMYEMLTGTRPFLGSNSRSTLLATLRNEVPPPRQLNSAIDPELQRIVLRCLEKRMSDRYDSASALLADLTGWFESADVEAATIRHAKEESASSSSTPQLKSHGLQPFTEDEFASYLALVPGSRDRFGVPYSINFWKAWVASDDVATDFPVGVLYGPSGSGKTSFVRAGVLPQLVDNVCSVYVECRPGDLANRISRIIESKLSEPKSGSSLHDLLTRIRSDESSVYQHRKVLIVLDQFEAWSHRASLRERRDLADALRQCDGRRIRALVVIRDDFWMGATELLRWLEIPLQEGRNIGSVDLLDPPHAARILESTGREAGILPPDPKPLSAEQQQFISRAIAELSVSDSIVCAHLVMFAQMVRYQAWTPQALRLAGGVSGACSLFLRELFQISANSHHSPEYRRVGPAALPILSALLPERNSLVSTRTQSHADLQAVVVAAGRPELLDDCLRILTEDLCLVSVLAEASDDESESNRIEYRLSHDFLIAPIRSWVQRVSSQTMRGRANHILTRLSDDWASRPNSAQLPRFNEYLYLSLMSPLLERSKSNKQFMRASARHHAGRTSATVVAILAFIGMSILAWNQRGKAIAAREGQLSSRVQLLFDGDAGELADHIQKLLPFGDDARRQIAPWSNHSDENLSLRANLFLQTQQPETFRDIAESLHQTPAGFFTPIRDLANRIDDSKSVLRTRAEVTNSDAQNRFRSAILLGYLGDDSEISTLLSGSNDAEQDNGFVAEACKWRDEPDVWIKLLRDGKSATTRFNAGVILGSYSAADLKPVQAQIDFNSLLNNEAGLLHSIGDYLAAHTGTDADSLDVQPPTNGDWKFGPEHVPMMLVPANAYQHFDFPKRFEQPQVRTLDRSVWIASVPISRRLYNAFLEDAGLLDNGKAKEPMRVMTGAPLEHQLNADTDPVFGADLAHVFSLCNWLSNRDGLNPCYKYKPSDPGPEETVFQKFTGSTAVNWDIDLDADGYRMPTAEEYEVAVRANFKTGVPWSHAVAVLHASGDYPADGYRKFALKVRSLPPNRRGFFMHDPRCGCYVSSTRLGGITLGNTDIAPIANSPYLQLVLAIYIAQTKKDVANDVPAAN